MRVLTDWDVVVLEEGKEVDDRPKTDGVSRVLYAVERSRASKMSRLCQSLLHLAD
jgi:hypothetical protein